MSCSAAVAVALAVAALAAVAARGDADYSAGEHRLPRDTRPVAYGLQLAADYDQGSGQYGFAGHVQILIAVDTITPNVTLNAVAFQINSVAVVESTTQTDMVVDGFELLTDVERLVIYVGGNLLVGRRYEVKIAFKGFLRPDMTGFYRSIYTENGITKCVLWIMDSGPQVRGGVAGARKQYSPRSPTRMLCLECTRPVV